MKPALIEHNGEWKTAREWASSLGISRQRVYQQLVGTRLLRCGDRGAPHCSACGQAGHYKPRCPGKPASAPKRTNPYGPFGNAPVQCAHGVDCCPTCDGPWFAMEAKRRGMSRKNFEAECIRRAAISVGHVQAWLDGRTS